MTGHYYYLMVWRRQKLVGIAGRGWGATDSLVLVNFYSDLEFSINVNTLNKALYPSKLDIGHCQKAEDIVNLKSGY